MIKVTGFLSASLKSVYNRLLSIVGPAGHQQACNGWGSVIRRLLQAPLNWKTREDAEGCLTPGMLSEKQPRTSVNHAIHCASKKSYGGTPFKKYLKGCQWPTTGHQGVFFN